MSDEDRPLGVDEVIPLAEALAKDDGVFIVGGQAINLWAWFYRERDQRLKDAEPFTSQDIDYFGMPQAARRFAQIMGVEPRFPSPDDNTVNSAVVLLEWNGRTIRIDFLHSILGIKEREIRDGVSVITVSLGELHDPLEIKVMHPILCLKSRIANMLHPVTRRDDPISHKQLHAAGIIAFLYIEDAIRDNDVREAQECLKTILKFAEYDQIGREAHEQLGFDMLDVVGRFLESDGLHASFRNLTLRTTIDRVQIKRTRRRMDRARRRALGKPEKR